jgi:hypothetical protein
MTMRFALAVGYSVTLPGVTVTLLCSSNANTYLLTYFAYFHCYLLTPWSRVLLAKLTGSQSRNFMEPEGSLPHLQVPATCPPIYAWVFQVISFL